MTCTTNNKEEIIQIKVGSGRHEEVQQINLASLDGKGQGATLFMEELVHSIEENRKRLQGFLPFHLVFPYISRYLFTCDFGSIF